MSNKVTFQFRKFTDIDLTGKEYGDPTWGYCIYDDYAEALNNCFSAPVITAETGSIQELLDMNPQELLNYITETHSDFADVINGFDDEIHGFYINNTYHYVKNNVVVDETGKALYPDSIDECLTNIEEDEE